MMVRTSFLIAASTVIALAGASACGASVALENRPCPCASGYTCCAQKNVCVADGAGCGDESAPVGGFSRTAVSSAKSACAGSMTEGALDRAASAADATAKLATPSSIDEPTTPRLEKKGWIACNRDRWLVDRGGDGMVFAVDGTWSLLKLDGSGALTPLTGLGTHGIWAIYGEGSSAPLYRNDPSAKKITVLGLVDDGSTPGDGTTTLIEFEPSTARMRLTTKLPSSPPEQAWFAPVAGTPSCDSDGANDVHIPTCFCSAQCATLDSSACQTDTSASQCIAACQAATPEQRRRFAACAGPRLPPASGTSGSSGSPSCDSSCALTLGWDPNRSPDGSSDGN